MDEWSERPIKHPWFVVLKSRDYVLKMSIFKKLSITLSDCSVHSSSSSDRVDSRGPLRQPGMPTMGSHGPFSVDAERGTVAGLLYSRVSVLTAATCDSARWAGVWSSSLNTWSNSEFRLFVMMSWTHGRLVVTMTSAFLTKSYQRIPRIITLATDTEGLEVP